MRGVGQALDAVEVGYVVVLGFGEFLAELAVVLSPDDQGGRLEGGSATVWAGSHRGPVVVDHPVVAPGCNHAST